MVYDLCGDTCSVMQFSVNSVSSVTMCSEVYYETNNEKR